LAQENLELADYLYDVWHAYSSGWGLVVSSGMYLWLSLCLMVIARKAKVNGWWVGWVPLLNLKLMCVLGKLGNSFFLVFVGVFGAIVVGLVAWWPLWLTLWLSVWAVCWVVVWMRISRERGRHSALGILVLVPVLNLVLFGAIAFGD